MKFIDQWIENSVTEAGNITNKQHEQLINSISVKASVDSSYIEDSNSSSDGLSEVRFQSYEPTGGVKKLLVPLQDSSANLNFEVFRSLSGGLQFKSNNQQLQHAISPITAQLSFDMEDNIVQRLHSLTFTEDKENTGEAKSESYYLSSKFPQMLDSSVVRDIFSKTPEYFGRKKSHHGIRTFSENQTSCELQENESLEKDDETDFEFIDDKIDEDDDNCSELILNEFPIYKSKASCSGDSLTITPNLLKASDGNITFFQELSYIEDKSYLPRHFQNHRLKKPQLKNQFEPYDYFKNKNCPSSADIHKVLNYCHHRYSRTLKSHKGPFKEDHLEVLCRFCRGKNWILKPNYKEHLTLSHGIFTIDYVTPPIFLPVPRSMFILRERSLKTFRVNCPKCSKWIRLGNSIYDGESENQPRTQGLYYNYFIHYLRSHEDGYEKTA